MERALLVGKGIFLPTRVFSTTAPLDEADDEQDEDDEGDGTHQPDEPALSGDVHLVYVGWRHRRQNHRSHHTWTLPRTSFIEDQGPDQARGLQLLRPHHPSLQVGTFAIASSLDTSTGA